MRRKASWVEREEKMMRMMEQQPNRGPVPTGLVLWVGLSLGAAILAATGSGIALASPGLYAGLTSAFLDQALAQDIANLGVVVPPWIVVGALALRGSVGGALLWLGVLAFTVYNYVIYTFAIPFGLLFYLWVAVLGLCFYALLGGALSLDKLAVQSRLAGGPTRLVGWFLIVTAVLFCFLWLSEDVPALVSGTRPASLVDLNLLTNPVHILDLGFFLPGVLATGVLLLRKAPLGYLLAPPSLVFLFLTGLPILITPVVQTFRGESAAWGVVVPIGLLTLGCLGLLVALLVRRSGPSRDEAR